jgi:hypothetical protein
MHDKGKFFVAPSSPSSDSTKLVSSRMHLRDDCSHVINEIKPQGSTQPKAIQGIQKGIETTKEQLPLKVANTVFDYVLLSIY